MPEPKKRADAQANYDRILEAALEALTRDPDASLNSIAKTAGVGAGTLYRHFPTREDLIIAVYQHELDELVEAAYSPRLVELEPTQALRTWFDRLAQYGMTKSGLGAALTAAAETLHRDASITRVPMVEALAHLLHRAQEAGDIRSDVTADDVLLAVGFLWRMDPASDWHAQAARLLDLVVAGLRAPVASPAAH